jgi:hypothetical protein
MDAAAGCTRRKASAFFFEIDQKKATAAQTRRDKQRRCRQGALDRRVAREALETFQRSVAQAFGMFEGVVAEFHRLSDDETLSYLKRQVSPRATSRVRAPAGAAFLDGLSVRRPAGGRHRADAGRQASARSHHQGVPALHASGRAR